MYIYRLCKYTRGGYQERVWWALWDTIWLYVSICMYDYTYMNITYVHTQRLAGNYLMGVVGCSLIIHFYIYIYDYMCMYSYTHVWLCIYIYYVSTHAEIGSSMIDRRGGMQYDYTFIYIYIYDCMYIYIYIYITYVHTQRVTGAHLMGVVGYNMIIHLYIFV